MLRLIPQMATPITFRDLAMGLKGFFSQQNVSKGFEANLAALFGSRFCYTVSSGRVALYVILKTLKRLSAKREVVIPVYTCPIVAYAVAKVGLDIVLCDIDKGSFGLDPTYLEEVITENTLCVVPTHLFGLPCRLDEIKEIINSKNLWMVEDAAQAAGSSLNGIMLGSIGDFGILSFGAGKNFTPAGGGAILTEERKWASEIELTLLDLPQPRRFADFRSLVTLILYSFLIYPQFFWTVRDLVMMIEEADQSQDFSVSRLTNYQAAVGISILERIRDLNEIRKRNAQALIKALNQNENVTTPRIPGDSQPSFLRLPVMVKNTEQRERVYRRLEERGIQARKPFSTLMNQLGGVSPLNKADSFPNAEYVVDRILTLPVHPFIGAKEIKIMIQIFKELS